LVFTEEVKRVWRIKLSARRLRGWKANGVFAEYMVKQQMILHFVVLMYTK
jgi:hypothetical protein